MLTRRGQIEYEEPGTLCVTLHDGVDISGFERIAESSLKRLNAGFISLCCWIAGGRSRERRQRYAKHVQRKQNPANEAWAIKHRAPLS
jgi:hypothetical protein